MSENINEALSSLQQRIRTSFDVVSNMGGVVPSELSAKTTYALSSSIMSIPAGSSSSEPWTRPSDWPRTDLIETTGNPQVIFLIDTQDPDMPAWIGVQITASLGAKMQELSVDDDGSYTVLSSASITARGSYKQWVTYDGEHRYRAFRLLANSTSMTSLNMLASPDITDPELTATGITQYQMEHNKSIKEIIEYRPGQPRKLPSTVYLLFPEHLIERGTSNNMSLGYNQALKCAEFEDHILSSMTSLAYARGNCPALRQTKTKIKDGTTVAKQAWRYYFFGDYALEEADISYLSGTTPYYYASIDYMFGYCYNLRSIKGFDLLDTSSLTSTSNAFLKCQQLERLDLHDCHWNELTTMSHMYDGCTSLQHLDPGHLEEATKLTTVTYAFSDMKSITDLNLSCLDTPVCKNFSYMFYNDVNLAQLDISNINLSAATNIAGMFSNCSALKVLKLPTDSARGPKLDWAFNICTQLTHESLLGILNFLPDLTGQTSHTLTLGSTLLAKITDEEKLIATNKNWTLA